MIPRKAGTKKGEASILLDSIRSVHNVGSIFRTAETLGVSMIYCAGTTPTPVDRFGRKRPDFAKVALGAESLVAWKHIEKPRALVAKLKKDGYQIVALEQAVGSKDYKELDLAGNVLIILGNEVDGVSKPLLNEADVIAEIPMRGAKESLNVSVAAGIFLYRLLDKSF